MPLENLDRVGPPDCLFWGGFGGADRDRTDDLRLAKPALSQLSYSPGCSDQRLDRLSRAPTPAN
jgi:hypothetical protein